MAMDLRIQQLIVILQSGERKKIPDTYPGKMEKIENQEKKVSPIL